MDEKKSTELVPVTKTRAELPPILVGRVTPRSRPRSEASTSLSPTSSSAGSPGARARTRSGLTART